MKKVVVLSIGKRAGDDMVSQIRSFFRDIVAVEGYGLNDPLRFEPGEVLAVLSGPHVAVNRPEVANLIRRGMECVNARRSIDYTRILDLLALPAGTDVLLVNDYELSVREVTEHLKRVGLDHVHYHPYYPGIPEHASLKVAVTPGEAPLVPPGVEKIIDIGSRLVDISTIVELVQRLGLMDQLGETISSQHLGDITRLLREINRAGKRVSDMRDTLQILADYAPNGILYTDLAGRVILGNYTMSKVLRMDGALITNRPLVELVPELAQLPAPPEASVVLSLGGQEVVVWARPVKQDLEVIGHIYVFETSHSIQDLEYELRRKTRKSEHEARYTFHDIIAKSPRMEWILSYAQRIAQSDSTILILGPTGTGKELFAQAIHNASRRRQGPFVPVNFSAFPASLLESELFGYEEGAFTGASRGGKRGLFAEAHGGTLFLDEIGDAPLEFQVRLLRVLQEREVRPVGGLREIPVDVRVIAATHRDLGREVQQGQFREDLFYRLSVVPLRMPSLRERKEDIPLLIEQFIRNFSHGRKTKAGEIMTAGTFDHLCSYPWPGNIRQLMNVVDFLMNIHEDNHLLEIQDLPEYLLRDPQGQDDSLIKDVLGEELVWMLGKIRDAGGLGRRQAARLAAAERPQISDAMLRELFLTAKTLGLIQTGTGRARSAMTGKGLRLTDQWVAGVLNG